MNRLESIKERFALTKHISVDSYDPDFAADDIEYLLQRLERYETSLKAIVNYDDGLLRVHEEVAELVGIYEKIAKEALKDETIQP